MLSVAARAMLLGAAVAAGCGGEPAYTHGPVCFWGLAANCRPAGVNLQCTATYQPSCYYGGVAAPIDVTSGVGWSTSDPEVASVSKTGFVTPLRRGEVSLHASWYGQPAYYLSDHAFLVDPAAPPRLLYYLAGVIKDEAACFVEGAVVEILDGYNLGRSATTSQGGYYKIPRVLTGEAFTVRASRPGYEPQTTTHRICEDHRFDGPPVESCGSSRLNFLLRHAP